MQDIFLAFIQDKNLFSGQDRILLAVSGGLDSVVMAHLFAQSPYSFGIAHVNFELRAQESEEDARFVAALAAQLHVPFHTKRLAAGQAAEEQHVSIQMAARDLRYQWFAELCQQEGYACIATAHHQNDVAETMLLNLSRGTGIAGLHGIAAKRDKLVRPLLFASRQQLEAYAHEQQLSWREDSSNSSLKYRRNKIRQQVIPVLKELNPRLEASLQETAHRLAAAELLLQGLVEQLREQVLKQQGRHYCLQLGPLVAESSPRYLLAALLEPFGAGWQEAGAILKSMHKFEGTTSGKWFSTPSHRLNLDRGQLLISPLENSPLLPEGVLSADAQEVKAGPWLLHTRRLPAAGYKLTADPAVAALDFQKLQFPLQLRAPAPGDIFQPLGMRGKKKLSDFMIDHKIPLNLKSEVLLVLSGEEIAWVAGYRPDDRFKLDPQTQEVFEIRLTRP